ncbi:hypothetical protein RUND412_005725 [Rhizina undulata]
MVQVGEFYWGGGINLHTSQKQRMHLGASQTPKKNRKSRCFYVLQVLSDEFILACSTTTRNSKTWDKLDEAFHKFFLPVHLAPEKPGRVAIKVLGDEEQVFQEKSLLFIEAIEVVRVCKLRNRICTVAPDEIVRIRDEARQFVDSIYWGEVLSPLMWLYRWEELPNRYTDVDNEEFVDFIRDEDGLLILDANIKDLRFSKDPGAHLLPIEDDEVNDGKNKGKCVETSSKASSSSSPDQRADNRVQAVQQEKRSNHHAEPNHNRRRFNKGAPEDDLRAHKRQKRDTGNNGQSPHQRHQPQYSQENKTTNYTSQRTAQRGYDSYRGTTNGYYQQPQNHTYRTLGDFYRPPDRCHDQRYPRSFRNEWDNRDRSRYYSRSAAAQDQQKRRYY